MGRVKENGRAYGSYLNFEVHWDNGTGEWHVFYRYKPVDSLAFIKPSVL